MINDIHIDKTATYMVIAIMCNFQPKRQDLPHRKYVLQCCSNCTSIFITVEYYNRYDAKCVQKKCFCVYTLLSYCTVHDKCSLE